MTHIRTNLLTYLPALVASQEFEGFCAARIVLFAASALLTLLGVCLLSNPNPNPSPSPSPSPHSHPSPTPNPNHKP